MSDPTDWRQGTGQARSPKGGKPEEGDGPGKGKEPGKAERRGGGSARWRPASRRPVSGEDTRTPLEAREAGAHRASMMQLEEFRKTVDKDVLKKMKMSREEFEKFLRDYADLAKREPKQRKLRK